MSAAVVPRWRSTPCCRGSAPAREIARTLAPPAVRTARRGRARPVEPEPLASPQGRVFSPPPPSTSPIAGLIDFHTHSAPDVFGRAVDDDEMAELYRARQLEAVVFKSHVALTADRAWLVRKHVPGIKVFGGIALNAAVGGLNPQAVEWMWRMQGGYGRVVWLPTFDADNHVTHFADAPAGIRVVDDGGNAVPALREVLKVCARQQLVLQTGHASALEALAVIAAARDAGCDRIVVTHAEFGVVNMSTGQMVNAAKMGAKLELCSAGTLMGPNAHLEWMRHWRQVTLKETAERIRTVGAQHFVLGTDLGQTGNPTPPDGLQAFIAGLMAEGITRDDITTMGREVPGALLMG